MKKIIALLFTLFTSAAIADSIPAKFQGTWGEGHRCNNPANIEKNWVSPAEYVSSLDVRRIVPINDDQIEVFAKKFSMGIAVKEYDWLLVRQNEFLIMKEATEPARLLKRSYTSTAKDKQ